MAIRAWGRIRPGPGVSVPLLSNVLRDADPAIRTEALDILADIGQPAVPTLTRLLGRDDVVYWCCMALGEIGPDAAAAAPALAAGSQQQSAARGAPRGGAGAGAIGPAAADCVPALTAALDSRDPAVAAGAAYALGQIGPKAKAADSSLAKYAAGSDPLVKAVSVWALAKIEPQNESRKQTAVAHLVAALRSDQPQLRHAALRGLADLKPAPEAALPAMSKALQDNDKSVAGAALFAVASFGDPAIPALTDALKRKELRPAAARILAQMGSRAKGATPALVEIVRTDRNGQSRSEALLALAATDADPKTAVPAAIDALHSQREDVRCAACFALGRMGKPAAAAVPELQKKLGDSDECGALAAWALVRIAPDSPQVARQLVPIFVKALNNCEPMVRVEAAASLQRLGPLAKDAIPALKRASADNDETVHAAALAALGAVGNPVRRE